MGKIPFPRTIDCRNLYETHIGTFQHALPLDTVSFSETWDKLDELLGQLPKDKRILTFCTGGIRCVKVNAYLKQKLKFENIGRLEKGIIAYENYIDSINQTHTATGTNLPAKRKEAAVVNAAPEPMPHVESLFQGKNFLFDRRRLLEDEQLIQENKYYK